MPDPPRSYERDRLAADAALRALLDDGPQTVPAPADAFRVYDLMVNTAFGSPAQTRAWTSGRAWAFAARVALFARWLVAARGGVAAICAADLVRDAQETGRSPPCRSAWHDPFSLGLRQALTGAPEEEFGAARDAALALAGAEDWARRAFFAFLLADDGPTAHALQFSAVVAEAVHRGADLAKDTRLVPLLAEMRPSIAAAWRVQRRGLVRLGSVNVQPSRLAATVAAAAARHGEPALPGLFWLYRQAEGDDEELFARAVLETRDDDAVARLVADLHRRPARAALGRAASADPAWTFGRCLTLLAAGRGGPAMPHRVREMVDRHGAEKARRWAAGLADAAVVELERLLAGPSVGLAPPEALPAFLRTSPWRRVAAAAAAGIEGDPPLDRPRIVPVLPGWFVPANLMRPVLKGGGALPDESMVAVAGMLAFSTRDDIHAGIPELKQCCTRDSLDAFAGDLFSAWLARGGPGQSLWVIRAVGWLGSDACVEALMPAIRRWLDMKARPQAAMGIEALSDIGSDAALLRLADLAERLGSKSLRAKAARHLTEVAEARGLSSAALADRIAPDIGLDARGGLDLDFGPRRFRASFDERLKPLLRDGAGKAIKDLPKPGRNDDPERAAAATALWAGTKRAARAAAGLQLARLEAMLTEARRVTPEVFRTCFASHPFVAHPARRLVWARYAPDPGAAPAPFTLTADREPVDADGAPLPPGEGGDAAMIGLVHPSDLPASALAAWRLRFASLGWTQPFPQIDRDVHRLTAAERRSDALHRVRDVRVDAGWLRGMVARGWTFERPQEDALMWSIGRPVVLSDGSTGRACLDFVPGLIVGTPERDEPPRALGTLRLLGPTVAGAAAPMRFDILDAVTASELIRSVVILAGRGAHPTPAEWGQTGAGQVTVQ